MKEVEVRLREKDISLKRVIEMLSTVGQGVVQVGETQLDTESDNTTEIQAILNLFLGH